MTWLENVLHTLIVHKCNITENIPAHASADTFFAVQQSTFDVGLSGLKAFFFSGTSVVVSSER